MSAWVRSGAAAEIGYVTGTILAVVGLGLLVYGSITRWDALPTTGPAASVLILAVMLALLGVILLFNSFFLSFFEIKRRGGAEAVERTGLRSVPVENHTTFVVRTSPAAAVGE